MRQAPRAWFERLRSTLQKWNFKNSKADSSLFYLSDENEVMLVLIYVDDIIITGSNSQKLKQFTEKLNQGFSLKDLKQLNYFLGVEVYWDDTGIYLSQGKYISELLKKYNMTYLKPCPTPMTIGKPLSISDGTLLDKPTEYRSLIGALQYLTHTRPDLSFAVNKLSQFLKAPTDCHWSAAKRVLRYLKGTIDLGLHIKVGDRLILTGFSDADWACCPDDRRSIAGYCVYLGDTLVSWSSKKQAVISSSSTESKYRALAQVAAEMTWIQSLLNELQFTVEEIPVTWCDNMGANALASNPVYHARTKHIELDMHFVRDTVLAKELDVRFIPSFDQVADCLTKSLSNSRFHFLINKLGVVKSPLSLRGGVRK